MCDKICVFLIVLVAGRSDNPASHKYVDWNVFRTIVANSGYSPLILIQNEGMGRDVVVACPGMRDDTPAINGSCIHSVPIFGASAEGKHHSNSADSARR